MMGSCELPPPPLSAVATLLVSLASSQGPWAMVDPDALVIWATH